MATLKIRFKLNPGRTGIQLNRLSKQAENIELFLRSLSEDIGANGGTQTWLATNFKDGSFISDIEHQAVVEVEQVVAMNQAIIALAKFRTIGAMPDFVSPSTISRFADLRTPLDDGEQFGIALFNEQTGRCGRFQFVDKLRLEKICDALDTEVRYFGSISGTTHGWHKGAEPPYLLIRDIATNDLVKCTYRDRDYSRVSEIFTKKSAVVTVEGSVLFNRITGKSEILEATDFAFAPSFSAEDFEAFFGCAPGMSGDVSSEEAIARGRNDE